MNMQDKVAVVAGRKSGIGLAIAEKFPPSGRQTALRHLRRWAKVGAAVGAVAALVAAGLLTQSAAADRSTSLSADVSTQAALDDLVVDEGFPGALASVQSPDGRIRNFTAGVAELDTGRKVPVDGQVRIGSNTKTFTATVVLQLVGEGKVALEDPIEEFLPGLVRGTGINGRDITIRQLLQHTSGLPDYVQEIAGDFAAAQHTYVDPRGVLDIALRHPALFAPGTGWSYSNTNYILAGLLVEKVTGRPIGEEITHRVIDKVGLTNTYWPGLGEQTLRGKHPQGYFALNPVAPLTNVTVQDPSGAWAAGQLVSTPSDVNRFFSALMSGKLLKPAQLAAMRTTVPAPGSSVRGDERYGLGLKTFSLTCGGFAWGHGGDIPGFETRNAVTRDGRSVSLAVTALPTTAKAAKRVEDVVNGILCN